MEIGSGSGGTSLPVMEALATSLLPFLSLVFFNLTDVFDDLYEMYCSMSQLCTLAEVISSTGNLAAQVELVYTDISRQLVGYGRKTYGPRFPFAAFKFLDVEQPLEQQGFAVGQTDIVFATNVLHATRDMGATLQHCKALLKNGGLLIANELTTKTDFLTLTFGLTDGWWLFDDEARRIPGAPIISRSLISIHILFCAVEALGCYPYNCVDQSP